MLMYGDVGAHGNTMISTPHLDRLAAESVRLTDFHVDPTCSPTRSALSAIAGVKRVESIGTGALRLHHAPDGALAERIAAASVAGDWGLCELIPERRSLEEIFVDLTLGEGDGGRGGVA